MSVTPPRHPTSTVQDGSNVAPLLASDGSREGRLGLIRLITQGGGQRKLWDITSSHNDVLTSWRCRFSWSENFNPQPPWLCRSVNRYINSLCHRLCGSDTPEHYSHSAYYCFQVVSRQSPTPISLWSILVCRRQVPSRCCVSATPLHVPHARSPKLTSILRHHTSTHLNMGNIISAIASVSASVRVITHPLAPVSPYPPITHADSRTNVP
jgi:hypothetical protein